ncbi:MAG: clostripain-related cysteine peptidase [Desulfurococcaceae archaeon]|nr:clostripain-related cysteine peptidase [Sulfolobales archaeon]MDW8169520.1 clostripain-related cysteine peptidase [Desulfurococcaceae archaeon]
MSSKWITGFFTTLLLLTLLLPPVLTSAGNSLYKWTIMIYMDADNDLERAGIEDFNEMEMAGSTKDVAIVVMFDRHPGYDSSNNNWSNTRIYLVKRDLEPNIINSQLLLDLNEMNMGDPDTLVFLANYTAVNFPAEHYMLVIWDHGNAWRRSFREVRGVAYDYSDNDYIDERELIEALDRINSEVGVHLDILGFDACLEAMAEVAYDIGSRGYADILVASQEYEPFDGWYYTKFLTQLIANPGMSPIDLAKAIVSAYEYYYTAVYPLDYPTLSAVDLVNYIEYAVPYMDLASMYMTYNVYLNPSIAYSIKELRDACDKTGEGEFIDVVDLFEKLLNYEGWLSNYDPRPMLASAISALKSSIIVSWSAPGHPKSHGLSIYMPPSIDWYLEERYWYFYQTSFPTETWWGLFLDYYFKAFTPMEELLVEVAAPSYIDAGLSDYALVHVTYGNKMIDPDSLSVECLTNGLSIPLNAIKLMPGLYLVSIPLFNEATTIFILVRADYWFLSRTAVAAIKVSNFSSSIESIHRDLSSSISQASREVLVSINESSEFLRRDLFSINSSLTQVLTAIFNDLNASITVLSKLLNTIDAKVVNLTNGVLTLNTSIGLVKLKLSEISIGISGLYNDLVTVKTILGELNLTLEDLNTTLSYLGSGIVEIKTSLGTIYGEVVSVNNGVALVRTNLGDLLVKADDIHGYVEELKKDQGNQMSSIYLILAFLTILLVVTIFNATRRK